MKILIDEDDPVSGRVLEANPVEWDDDVSIAPDGREALPAADQLSGFMCPHFEGIDPSLLAISPGESSPADLSQ